MLTKRRFLQQTNAKQRVRPNGFKLTLARVTVSSKLDVTNSLHAARLQMFWEHKAVRNIGITWWKIDDLIAMCNNVSLSSKPGVVLASMAVKTSRTVQDTCEKHDERVIPRVRMMRKEALRKKNVKPPWMSPIISRKNLRHHPENLEHIQLSRFSHEID